MDETAIVPFIPAILAIPDKVEQSDGGSCLKAPPSCFFENCEDEQKQKWINRWGLDSTVVAAIEQLPTPFEYKTIKGVNDVDEAVQKNAR